MSWMKELAKEFVDLLWSIVQDIPNGTEAKAITLEDLLPSKEF